MAPRFSSGQRLLTGLTTFLKKMRQRPVALFGLVMVLCFVVVALVGPLIAPYEFDEVIRGEDRRAIKRQPPSADFIMGTDLIGRDVFSRVLWGARETLLLPAVATILAVSAGAVIGLATGYIGGWFDEIISRALDILLAIPSMVLALVMLTTLVPILSNMDNAIIEQLGPNNISLTIVIVLLYIPIVTRVIRSATLNVRASGYVEAARLRSESTLFILFSEILPAVMPSLVVEGSLRLSYAIFLVASLGFLGLGVQPPSPEWGRQVLDARTEIELAPWSLYFPALAIATLIVSVNLMSDGLRYALRNED